MIYVFYHVLCQNHYILNHNMIFAKIRSNPLFDDAKFYVSYVGKLDDRMWWPKNCEFVEYQNTFSEFPIFDLMRTVASKKIISDADHVLYIHGKGNSHPSDRENKNSQHTLLSVISQRNWVDVLTFFLIEHADEMLNIVNKYHTACLFPTRHLFGNNAKAGTLGNMWWCSGRVLNALPNIDFNITTNRHFYEVNMLQKMLEKSELPPFSYYVHDGSLHTYTTDSITTKDSVFGYLNSNLMPIINIEYPLDINNPAVVIISPKFKLFHPKNQRFKNVIYLFEDDIIPTSLITIKLKTDLSRAPAHWLDNMLKSFKNKTVYNINETVIESPDYTIILNL